MSKVRITATIFCDEKECNEQISMPFILNQTTKYEIAKEITDKAKKKGWIITKKNKMYCENCKKKEIKK